MVDCDELPTFIHGSPTITMSRHSKQSYKVTPEYGGPAWFSAYKDALAEKERCNENGFAVRIDLIEVETTTINKSWRIVQ